MPAGKVIRFCDYEKRSRQPDSEHPRDPADADVIEFMPKRAAHPSQHAESFDWSGMQMPCDC